jgi:putative hydrolase of HD superfamily
MSNERLTRQLAFIAEIDALKKVERRTSVIGGARLENSAEHSWHLAVMAMLLGDHANGDVDLERVLCMLLVHDLVEIDAGDTFAFDAGANVDKMERETRAAERIFGILPDDQSTRLRALWDEFEEAQTVEARFANALDRLQGLVQNHHNGGGTWVQHGVTRAQVLERMEPIRTGAPRLWPHVLEVVDGVFG